jgi:hypothetical protein
MMTLHLFAAAALVAAFSATALAADDEKLLDAFEADCKKYALEDGVPETEMEAYVAQCVKDMMAYQSEDAAKESEGGTEQR